MDEYKNTPEGRIVQRKYADILHSSRPLPIKPPMPLSSRAKIFSPFAALRGYEEEIAEEGREHLSVCRIELSEEEKEEINKKITQIKKGAPISVHYFSSNSQNCLIGEYIWVTGIVEKVDDIAKKIWIKTGEMNELGKILPISIDFEDITDLN